MNIHKLSFHKHPVHLIVYQGQRWLMAGELQQAFGMQPTTNPSTDMLPDDWFRSLNDGLDYEVWEQHQIGDVAAHLGVPPWFANGRLTVIKVGSLPELHNALCESTDYQLAYKFKAWVDAVLAKTPLEAATPPR
jgi:prophage antirepressor-like protein